MDRDFINHIKMLGGGLLMDQIRFGHRNTQSTELVDQIHLGYPNPLKIISRCTLNWLSLISLIKISFTNKPYLRYLFYSRIYQESSYKKFPGMLN